MVEITEQDRSDLKVARAMRSLIVSEGWHHLARLLSVHIAEMERQVLMPYRVARSADAMLTPDGHRETQVENKGALYGLRLALNLPKSIIEAAEDIAAKVPPEQRHVIEEE